jgi:glycosyltransferase involved in cell wall biosynthesis
VRQKLGISENAPWIVNVGNLYPVKGQVHLLRAFALVSKAFPEAVLSIIGRGNMKVELRNEIKRFGLEKKAFLYGFREDISDLLGACDIFVMSSLSEGLPLSLLEAIASGIPVVASDVGGIGEVVFPDWSGRLTPAGDEKALSEAISKALSDPEGERVKAKNAYNLAEERFSLKAMVNSYESVYDSLVKGSILFTGAIKHQEKIS